MTVKGDLAIYGENSSPKGMGRLKAKLTKIYTEQNASIDQHDFPSPHLTVESNPCSRNHESMILTPI
jgi:hypothetical protein